MPTGIDQRTLSSGLLPAFFGKKAGAKKLISCICAFPRRGGSKKFEFYLMQIYTTYPAYSASIVPPCQRVRRLLIQQ